MHVELTPAEYRTLDSALEKLTTCAHPRKIMEAMAASVAGFLPDDGKKEVRQVIAQRSAEFERSQFAAMRLRLKLREISERAEEFTPAADNQPDPNATPQ